MLSTSAKMRIAHRLYQATRLVRLPFGGRDEALVTRRGVRWQLDLREGIDLTIYLAGAFELDTLRCLQQNVRPGATVLDIGANIGAHTLHLARLVGLSGRVFAFEPTAFAFGKLQANLALNPDLRTRVTARQAFLVSGEDSAKEPVRAIASSWPVDGRAADDTAMGSRLMDVSGSSALTLDAAMEAVGNPDVALIKIDVDGNELDVFRGARGVLHRCRPTIVMELAPYVFHPPEDFDRMVSLLFELGYALRPLHSQTPLPRGPVRLRRHIPSLGSMNVVAAPQGLPLSEAGP